VLSAQSQTVQSSFAHKEGLILPGQVRACPEIFARILREEDYAASVVQRWTVTEGPGKDRTGGVAFRLKRCVPSS